MHGFDMLVNITYFLTQDTGDKLSFLQTFLLIFYMTEFLHLTWLVENQFMYLQNTIHTQESN